MPDVRVVRGWWLGAAALSAVLSPGCDCAQRPPTLPAGPAHSGAATVWAVDDGERIAQDAGDSALMRGEGNLVWSPGEALRLFGLRDETLAFQLVVSAGEQALTGVTVAFSGVDARCLGAPQRFVVAELPMARRSGGKHPRESLGWTDKAMPPSVKPGGALPDPLIPVELAPAWADYPMTVPAGKQRVVWVDVQLPAAAPGGTCTAQIVVKRGAQLLAEVPLQVEIAAKSLPYRAVKTMVYFDPAELLGRFADEQAIARYEQLMHAHQLSTVMPLLSVADVARHGRALDGSLFSAEHGYDGPGRTVGADVAVLGAYGSLGKPTEAALGNVGEMLAALGERGVSAPLSDVFVYAVDEQCDSPLGADWRRALDASADPALRAVRVGHTCSTPPANQPVDVVMVLASEYDSTTAALARQAGKQVWIYNGVLPYTGSFLTDAWPLSLRANAWIQARYGIERWFYWESTFWDDNNRGGLGRYDPLAKAETFHNQDGDHCNGDGVLVYPGSQPFAGYRTLGKLEVVPSIRLKQWRRGISDMGYLMLARQLDRALSDASLRRVVPAALHEARGQATPPWSVSGADYLRARRALFEIIKQSP